jgi:hypothetical protein
MSSKGLCPSDGIQWVWYKDHKALSGRSRPKGKSIDDVTTCDVRCSVEFRPFAWGMGMLVGTNGMSAFVRRMCYLRHGLHNEIKKRLRLHLLFS